MVYLRDAGGLMEMSSCCPAASSADTDSNGARAVGLGVSPGYHFRTHSLSAVESFPGGTRPWRSYCSGSSISPGSNSYSMIESGSHAEPCTCWGESFSRMLWNVVAWLQLLGGCASESYTACSCHLMPANGF